MVLNVHRLNYARRYAAKLFSREGVSKILHDPGSVYRTAKTFLQNRNLRKVPDAELLKDAESSVATLGRMAGNGPAITFAEWLPMVVHNPDTASLGTLLNSHGSDKSTEHDYFEVYGSILHGKRAIALDILEIGLGTNDLTFQSNMGLGGRPGASQRAFRDWAPNAKVVGADIDRSVLFQEDRIETYWVDQTDSPSLIALVGTIGKRRFDLIIDDGLHLPHSNFKTMEALLPLLAKDGVFVVEDIDAIHLHYWRTAASVLAARYDTYLVSRRGGYLFVVRGIDSNVPSLDFRRRQRKLVQSSR